MNTVKLLDIADPIQRDIALTNMIREEVAAGTLLAGDLLRISTDYGMYDLYQSWFDGGTRGTTRFNEDYTFRFKVLDTGEGRLERTLKGEFWVRRGWKELLMDPVTRKMSQPNQRSVAFWIREFEKGKNPAVHPEEIKAYKIVDGIIEVKSVSEALDIALNYTDTFYDTRTQTPMLQEITAAEFEASKKKPRKSRKANATPQESVQGPEVSDESQSGIPENGTI